MKLRHGIILLVGLLAGIGVTLLMGWWVWLRGLFRAKPR